MKMAFDLIHSDSLHSVHYERSSNCIKNMCARNICFRYGCKHYLWDSARTLMKTTVRFLLKCEKITFSKMSTCTFTQWKELLKSWLPQCKKDAEKKSNKEWWRRESWGRCDRHFLKLEALSQGIGCGFILLRAQC